jgi:cell wall-associated NlpC family hydrolase
MIDISKFIGIPWKFNGDTEEGADCSGLALFFYRSMGWKPDTYDKPQETEWYIRNPYKMERFLLKHFNKVKDATDLTFGDLILCKINGESHMLIYISYGRCLSSFPTTTAQWNGTTLPDHSMLLHRDIWKDGFICGFRRKE